MADLLNLWRVEVGGGDNGWRVEIGGGGDDGCKVEIGGGGGVDDGLRVEVTKVSDRRWMWCCDFFVIFFLLYIYIKVEEKERADISCHISR
ncbi:hypothetical protein LguiA_018979 [Lonicera macranthoides]